MVTTTTDPAITELVRAITAGPDGAMWFTNANLDSVGQISTADSVTPTPDQGPAATALNVSGTGFAPGETVNVTYGTTSEASDAEPHVLGHGSQRRHLHLHGHRSVRRPDRDASHKSQGHSLWNPRHFPVPPHLIAAPILGLVRENKGTGDQVEVG